MAAALIHLCILRLRWKGLGCVWYAAESTLNMVLPSRFMGLLSRAILSQPQCFLHIGHSDQPPTQANPERFTQDGFLIFSILSSRVSPKKGLKMLTKNSGFHRISKESPSSDSESAYDTGMPFMPWLFQGMKYLSECKYLSEWILWNLEEWNFLSHKRKSERFALLSCDRSLTPSSAFQLTWGH